MNTTGNTILITGGSAGIGLAIAKQFAAQGNQIIITGRNRERLDQAIAEIANITAGQVNVVAIQSDVVDAADIGQLVNRVKQDYPQLNLLINNAGSAFAYSLGEDDTSRYAAEEIRTNYLAVVRLTALLLPMLKQQPEAAIVNVTSIVAFSPFIAVPTYSASKAALHVYTQMLREQLKASSVQVYELIPPLVNTAFSQAIGGAAGIPPEEVASDLWKAIRIGQLDVPVGQAKAVVPQ
ncbi:SDR family NAD(P)-dependent oxidoreductase [Parapedobacter sp. ISTM3]|uniref:Uncharacterized oxidoreductase n=1 Tax=Parapedobacter luteus TaxID=623280 RepID=A0A1T5AN22_9SPHI|nr:MULTISPECIES: SDR family NAD(P)-dependent oxidoreductase [Parapedobacter]MBK1441900.1 SDR family NAD(P)-dependent oxidoreductase [Parapedobacter sp. ISTM3]SKB36356.1 uncharacterized oxidoreductase [Parapedobacter luteus]